MIDELSELFAGPGAGEYLGEPVTIAKHMLQAEASGAAPALVAAALLHDVGHLLSHGNHNDIGAVWLSQWFGREVTEPEYSGLLSAESVRTLAVQGGPMSAAEVRDFEGPRYAATAVAVRRWDDAAKDPAARPPEFAHFSALLASLADGATWR